MWIYRLLFFEKPKIEYALNGLPNTTLFLPSQTHILLLIHSADGYTPQVMTLILGAMIIID